MFGLIDSFSFIWDLNDQPAQTEDCDKEVEDLSPYNEGTGEGSDSESKESIKKNSHISKKSIQRVS